MLEFTVQIRRVRPMTYPTHTFRRSDNSFIFAENGTSRICNSFNALRGLYGMDDRIKELQVHELYDFRVMKNLFFAFAIKPLSSLLFTHYIILLLENSTSSSISSFFHIVESRPKRPTIPYVESILSLSKYSYL